MGDFRIEVNATGGHGCQREIKDGGTVEPCGQPGCPDCIARKFVAELKASGNMVKDALLIHWPNGTPTIVDNLITKVRTGTFLMKLGRLPKKEHSRTLSLSKYVKLAAPPSAFAYEYNIDNWGMLGNDTVGDCTCACAAHMLMEWSSRTFGLFTPTLQQVIAAYSAVSGYDPATGANDNGAAITDVLAYWQGTGIAGRKILAWAAVDVTSLTAIKQAIQIFGGIDIGFNVPQTAMDEFSAGQPWNDTTDENIVGGHSVPVMGYGSQGNTCITWATRQQMSWDFWAKYVDEAYAIITQDWLTAAQKTPIFGFDLSTLQADLAALKQAA